MDPFQSFDFGPKPFEPATLYQSIIAMPLRQELRNERMRLNLQEQLFDQVEQWQPGEAVAPDLIDTIRMWNAAGFEFGLPALFSIIIDLNLEYSGQQDGTEPGYAGGRGGAVKWVVDTLNHLVEDLTVVEDHKRFGLNADTNPKNQYSQQYLFVKAEADVVVALVRADRHEERKTGPTAPNGSQKTGPRAIYHIWTDFKIRAQLNKSISTVKGDAAHAAYSAFGEDIVWAVMDSGIDQTHRHFAEHQNLALTSPLKHTDFTGAAQAPNGDSAAVRDEAGHGTHVAGIIGGAWVPADDNDGPTVYTRQRDDGGTVTYAPVPLKSIGGVASKCKLMSLKVLDENGDGEVSNLIAAIAMVQDINGYGRHLLVHGVNMSVGYAFDPEWFACGQSPICVEVDRLVRSGVVVVAAAGNTGYGTAQSQFNGVISAGLPFTINDPGNAEMAITVGSTHREMPHTYGVSYFSSKGPTGDGRPKPDLVAPGEKILSCAAGTLLHDMTDQGLKCDYIEDSGTSMAAPHVSGVVAAFLSIRREFIGHPERVKEIFMSTATDLKREKYFQGAGLVDLMRAIQSV
ncbi:S8 family peptidase [Hymenobacter terricola]|uniref:S8 family peptidase n=1 Tax=Hymenobacter terricola TaxID=2819236 RepID=UPI001B30BAD4|nr:S8 family peptidase [Hymenobacter terricola]